MFQLKVCHIDIKYLEIEILLLLYVPQPQVVKWLTWSMTRVLGVLAAAVWWGSCKVAP